MNELNELETILRSWAPRRPSAKLKQKIFGENRRVEGADTTEAEPIRPHLRLAWVAPVMAALLLVSLILGQRNSSEFTVSGPSSSMLAAALSNQNAAAWLAGSYTRSQNSLPTDTFEWTNGAGLTPTIRSFSRPARTN